LNKKFDKKFSGPSGLNFGYTGTGNVPVHVSGKLLPVPGSIRYITVWYRTTGTFYYLQQGFSQGCGSGSVKDPLFFRIRIHYWITDPVETVNSHNLSVPDYHYQVLLRVITATGVPVLIVCYWYRYIVNFQGFHYLVIRKKGSGSGIRICKGSGSVMIF